MKTIILPGQSLKNKIWAEETAAQMGLSDYTIIEWEHWKDGSDRPLDENVETEKGFQAIGQDQVHILAKSIGTYITMKLLQKIPSQIEKIIFCGIPLHAFTNNESEIFAGLSQFRPKQILVIQNENDPLGSFQEIKDFIGKINAEISVISKPRADHHYPIPEDFKNFLSL